MTHDVTFDARLSRSVLPASGGPQLIYVLLEANPGGGWEAVRLPLSLSLLVDRSQSMCIPILNDEQFQQLARRGRAREVVVDGMPVWEFQGTPEDLAVDAPRSLDFVKTALRSALERLGPNDRFSLTAFASQAQVVLRNESGTKKRRLLDAIEMLEKLKLGDTTMMGQGMGLALADAGNRVGPEVVSRLLVLTDGFTLDEAECIAQAQRATAQKIAISTIGLGVEFNDELMVTLADMTKGNAYFIHDPQDIPQVFASELSAVQAVVLRDLELKLLLSAGVELRKAHRVKPAIADLGHIAMAERSGSIPLGDLERDVSQSLLLELVAPPRAAGRYRLAQAVLAYDDPSRKVTGQELRQDLVVEYRDAGQAEPQLDPQVMSMAARVSAHSLQTRALDDAALGNIAGATVRLQAAYTRLLDMGEDELARTTKQELDHLQSQGRLSAAGTKRLRYETRRLSE